MATRDELELEWALKALRESGRQASYALARRYYDGDHPLMFATSKFESTFGKQLRTVADNLCPAVVDSVADRLKVTGVKAPIAPTSSSTPPAPRSRPPAPPTPPAVNGDEPAELELEPEPPAEPELEPPDENTELARRAWEIWQRNRMDVRAPETHLEALLTGDGYALVWPTAGEAVIWSIPACDCAVSYDPNRPGVIRRACRVWWDEDDGRIHVDIYTEDHVRRWVTRGARKSAQLSPRTTAREFLPYVAESSGGGSFAVEGVEPNPYGRVPLVHFPNRAYHRYGTSELKDVYPLQDALNKTVCDLLVSNEFAAFRQRYATGWAPDEPGNVSEYGADRMLYTSNELAKFGTFDASDARNFLETIESFRSEVARVSGTPLHYLFITRGDFPSGEAMKSAEARFTRKVENRQTSFGNQWEDLLALAVTMESSSSTPVDGRELSLEWESAEPTGLHEAPAAGPPPSSPPAAVTVAVPAAV